MTERIGATLRLLYPDGHTAELNSASATEDFSMTAARVDGVYTLTLTPQRAGLALAAAEYDIPLPCALTDAPED